jgi:hypothetical protein
MLSLDDLEILDLVLECCQHYQVEPLSSLEAEAFFNQLLADYPEPTNREGLRAWLTEQIPQHFRVYKARPRWIQGAAWAFAEGQPMIFGSLRFSVLGCPVTGQEDPQAKVRIIAEAEGAPFH